MEYLLIVAQKTFPETQCIRFLFIFVSFDDDKKT